MSNFWFIWPLTRSSPAVYCEYCILDGNLDACSVANIPKGVLATRVNPDTRQIRVDGQIRFEYGYVWTWKCFNPEREKLRVQKYPDPCGGGPNCNNNVQNVPCDNLIIIWPSILVVYLNKCFICYEDFRRLSHSFLRVISMEFLLVVLTVYKTVVMRIKGMITEGESYWYFDIFSLLLLQEMHGDNKWEFEFLSEGLKGYVLWYFFKRMLAAMLAAIRGYIHTAPDEFSTGWKFVRFGVEFTRNPLNRRKIKTPSRSKLRVNNAKILNGPVWTNCPVKFLDQFRFLGNCPPTPPLTRS